MFSRLPLTLKRNRAIGPSGGRHQSLVVRLAPLLTKSMTGITPKFVRDGHPTVGRQRPTLGRG
jgi:hypothetical protein